MKLKLKKIPTKPFILVFSTINVVTGLILGAVVTVATLVNPPEQASGEVGVWAVLIFPIINGLLGLATGAFLTGMYNFFARYLGGIELEFESLE